MIPLVLHDVRSVEVRDGYSLWVVFDDGAEGEVDIERLIRFDGVFTPLRDAGYFRSVRVDPNIGTICWPNGANIDAEILYDIVTGSTPS